MCLSKKRNEYTEKKRKGMTFLKVTPISHLYREFSLTSRFHVAVRLFSNRTEMTSNGGKNKKIVHEAIIESVTDVPTTLLTPSVIHY